MSQLTKRAIAGAFMQLLGQKKLDKITVQDITGLCGVNRQTFYYHFEDVYDLMRWIFENESARLIGENEEGEDWTHTLQALCTYVKDNKTVITNVYRSMGREELERFLCSAMMRRMLRLIEEESAGLKVTETEKQFVARFFSWAFVGTMLEWIGSDMREDVNTLVDHLCISLDGQVTVTLKKYDERARERK